MGGGFRGYLCGDTVVTPNLAALDTLLVFVKYVK